MNLVLVNAVKWRVAKDDILRRVTANQVICIQRRVTGGAIATNPIPVGIAVPIVAIVEVIFYLIAWCDEMAVEVSSVIGPGKLYFYGT
jgi:hypothetical protein